MGTHGARMGLVDSWVGVAGWMMGAREVGRPSQGNPTL